MHSLSRKRPPFTVGRSKSGASWLAGLWSPSEMKVPVNHFPAVRVIVIVLSAHSIPLEEMMVLIADRPDLCGGTSTPFIEWLRQLLSQRAGHRPKPMYLS